MAHVWRGLIEEYRDRLPVSDATPVITLREGGTPLVRADIVSDMVGCDVWLKYDGANPTGSFKDRGMTMAISKAAEAGAKVVICASTGNTSASAAAYATKAGMASAVLVPQGKIAMGKLAQAIVHGATLLQVDGNFDDCLELARKLAVDHPVELVNSVNPFRIEGQKTASFEIVDQLGGAPDIHALPVGNAGNITAYWKGYVEYAADGVAASRPRMWGFQAAGAAPIVLGHPVTNPETIATAIRIGNPASWHQAEAARDESGGLIDSVTDDEILSAYRLCADREGLFCEPASAASVGGRAQAACAGSARRRADHRLHADRQWTQGSAARAAGGPGPGGHPGRRPRRCGGSRAGVAVVELRRDAVRVVVPASSANIGPAFDCAGMALAVYDDLIAMVTDDEGVLVEIAGEGADTLPRDETHLVVQSMRAGFDWLGADVPGFILRCVNTIPHGRGLGSSAAAIVGGIVLARSMVTDGRDRMTDSDVLQLALRQESHPDNLSAALYGGFTVSWVEDGGFADAVPMAVHADVHPVVLVPPTELKTSAARAMLPDGVPFADAATNIGRSALLVHALTADPARLMAATEDRLHQRARASAYPQSLALVDALRAAGVPAVISGAGPTVLAFGSAETLAVIAGVAGDAWVLRAVEVSATGAREVPVPLDA